MGHFVACLFFGFFPQGFSLDCGIVPQSLSDLCVTYLNNESKKNPQNTHFTPVFVLTFNAQAHMFHWHKCL